MHCPFCQHDDTRVIDSRVSEDGATIRRRRECEACGERFNTLETAELKLPALVKSDGRREAFDERKLRTGFERALQKRPVSERADRRRGARGDPPAAHDRRARAAFAPARRVRHGRAAQARPGRLRALRLGVPRFEDVADFREEIERLERDLPGMATEQLPLLDDRTK